MSTADKHTRRAAAGRLGVTATVAATLTITTGIAALATARPAAAGSTAPGSTAPGSTAPGSTAPGSAARGPAPARRAGRPLTRRRPAAPATAAAPLALTGPDRQDCPAAATACVDLTRHLTWLQADGKVSFGPVAMEPGQPGTVHATPRGTFQVSWKAGPDHISNIYDEPMPWSTFFGTDGIAFHGGSLTRWSHGCIHLTVANAHHYQENLSIGAEVVVF